MPDRVRWAAHHQMQTFKRWSLWCWPKCSLEHLSVNNAWLPIFQWRCLFRLTYLGLWTRQLKIPTTVPPNCQLLQWFYPAPSVQNNGLTIRLDMLKIHSFNLSPASSERCIDDYFSRQLPHRLKPLHNNSWIHLPLVKLTQPYVEDTWCGSFTGDLE